MAKKKQPTDKATQELKEKLKDKWWRLNNLYWILDKDGRAVKFKWNWAQAHLWENMWFFNMILKSRQLGFTTAIDVWILDECLFHSNMEAGIIAHTKDDATSIFRRKIEYPYNNLPDWLKEKRPLLTDKQSEYRFSNNSCISVGVSMRSATLQLLHISEFGKIAAKYPEKAREIVTGSLETLAAGQIVFMESTAEGSQGYFYDYCQRARALEEQGKKLSMLDWRFFFYPWFKNPDNHLDFVDEEEDVIPDEFTQYFDEIEKKYDTKLTLPQRYWYVKKHNTLGEDMKREHPSTPDEAFQQSVKGAYFKKELSKARKEGRITRVPHEPGVLVHTMWDLGVNDTNAIWFVQVVGREMRVIDYYENSGEGLPHYKDVLDKKREDRGFRYGKHLAPHDIQVREWSTGTSRLQSALQLGIKFETVPRVEKKIDSIEAARRLLDICWIDEEYCTQGLQRIENYRKEWDERKGTYKDSPLHDENSNGADAFQTGAWGKSRLFGTDRVQAQKPKSVRSAGWT